MVPCSSTLLLVDKISTAASSDKMSENDVKLTKNQKKRRRKKSSSAKQETSTEPSSNKAAETSQGVANNAPMNPIQQVHSKLLNEGFTAKEVEVAMEEMWDKGMDGYDEFEAILAFLQSKSQPDSQQQQFEEAYSEPSLVQTDVSSSKSKEAMFHHEKTMEESKEEEPEEAQQNLDMSAKLDLVSDYEDLADATFAFNEWVSKIAKPSEVRLNSCIVRTLTRVIDKILTMLALGRRILCRKEVSSSVDRHSASIRGAFQHYQV